MQKTLLSLFLLLATTMATQAGNFDDILALLQSKCLQAVANDPYCGGLDLNGTKQEVYNKLVNVVPNNAAAAAKGYKWIYPGNPYKSFLLLKLNNGIVHQLDGKLDPEEGTALATTLTKAELELLRQWIYFGAPISLSPANKNIINQYYANGGLTRPERPLPPPPGQGFQVHVGPIFLSPSVEKEYTLKQDLDLAGQIEVNRLDLFINSQSHHYILYEYESASQANSAPNGFQEVNLFNTPEGRVLAAWQDPIDIRLPGGTAFYWDQNTVLNHNYHIPNYSNSAILPAEVYINVYTQPMGTAQKQMFGSLELYDPFQLIIPSTGQDITFSDVINNSQQWNLWMATTHTHKYGVDYDLYRRLPNGQKGDQIFEGFLDYSTNTNLGYYQWDEPPVRYYEPPIEIPAGQGMIQEAKFNNNSGSTVFFGLTTNEEMMLSLLQYTKGDPIPFVSLTEIKDYYCLNDAPVTPHIYPANGVLSGPGIQNNTFNPAAAGVGVHEISYTYENVVARHTIQVNAPIEQPSLYLENGNLRTLEGFDNYIWHLNGQLLENETSYTLTQSYGDGEYTVTTRSGGCTATSEPNVVTYTAQANTSAFSAEIYPNPTQTVANLVYYLDQATTTQITLSDLAGNTIRQWTTAPQVGKQVFTLDNSSMKLPSGIYLVRLQAGSQQAVRKLIIP